MSGATTSLLSQPLGLGLLLAAGVFAGFLNTLAGGGSMLTLPALMLLGLPAHVANGTNRVGVVAQALSGVWGFYRKGKLPTRGLLSVLGATVVGAILGSLVASRFPKEWLKPVLIAVMLSMAILMLIRPKWAGGSEQEQPLSLRQKPIAALALFAAGIYGGFVQAGVGFVLIGSLAGLLRYDLVRANAIKVLCTAAFASAALAVFIAAGQVAWAPGLVLAAGTSIGARIAVNFAIKVSPKVLKRIVFACALVTCGAAIYKMQKRPAEPVKVSAPSSS